MKYDIGICIPATSKGNSWKVWEDCDLKHSIDSILQTNSTDIKIKFYFCYDEEDKFYNEVKIRGMIAFDTFTAPTTKKGITFDTFTHNLQKKGNVVGMWNLLAERAKDECEYVMATGSDIKYLDNDWIIEAMNSLKKQNNIGVIGLTDLIRGGENDEKLLFTQSIVHRHHLLIFPTYYPNELLNWFCDDWITQVYRINKKDKMIKHRMINTGGNPRYRPAVEHQKIIADLVDRDSGKLAYWIDLKPRLFN
tara:strand:- start:651 stop:1400 length:750 start_codon:yes stop_codon:yes gene_type:complete